MLQAWKGLPLLQFVLYEQTDANHRVNRHRVDGIDSVFGWPVLSGSTLSKSTASESTHSGHCYGQSVACGK